MMNIRKIGTLYLLFLFISFIGFIYETILAYLMNFSSLDRGYLNLPLCPIYGFGVILIYSIFNTPKNMKIFKWKIKLNNKNEIYLYLILSALIATLLEFIVGYSFEYFFNIILWEYTSLNFKFNKYCALFPSIIWGLAITVFMNNIFEVIFNKIYKLAKEKMIIISAVSIILIVVDFFF